MSGQGVGKRGLGKTHDSSKGVRKTNSAQSKKPRRRERAKKRGGEKILEGRTRNPAQPYLGKAKELWLGEREEKSKTGN